MYVKTDENYEGIFNVWFCVHWMTMFILRLVVCASDKSSASYTFFIIIVIGRGSILMVVSWFTDILSTEEFI
jgi:hypothetical protein